jgi:hypothetical protein
VNLFNRVITVILALALLLLVLALAIFPLETVGGAQRMLQAAAAFFTTLALSSFWLYLIARIVLVLLTVLLFGLLLWGEIRPTRPPSVRVLTEAGSRGAVTTDSVARRLAWHVDQLPDVITVTPRVTARGQRVNVVFNVQTSPEIDVPRTTDEIVTLARQIITEKMGLQAGDLEVRITHAPYEEIAPDDAASSDTASGDIENG